MIQNSHHLHIEIYATAAVISSTVCKFSQNFNFVWFSNKTMFEISIILLNHNLFGAQAQSSEFVINPIVYQWIINLIMDVILILFALFIFTLSHQLCHSLVHWLIWNNGVQCWKNAQMMFIVHPFEFSHSLPHNSHIGSVWDWARDTALLKIKGKIDRLWTSNKYS